MKSEGIDSNIATQLGLPQKSIITAAAPISSALTMAASSFVHNTESRHLLDASALCHGKGKENTPPLGSSLVSYRDDELAISTL